MWCAWFIWGVGSQVCEAGTTGCLCEDNVCPAVEKIVGLLSVEALWALLFLLLLSLGLLGSVCVYMLCCRPTPQQVQTPSPLATIPVQSAPLLSWRSAPEWHRKKQSLSPPGLVGSGPSTRISIA
jgi:hypothetical protein